MNQVVERVQETNVLQETPEEKQAFVEPKLVKQGNFAELTEQFTVSSGPIFPN